MGFIDAGTQARLDRYIGYFEPYATSHEALDLLNKEPSSANLAHNTREQARGVRKCIHFYPWPWASSIYDGTNDSIF